MSIRNNFPTIRPSLNLDFANVKALDPRITFTRTTTATYYDGKTTAKAEENLLLQSQAFNTSWVFSQTTVNTDSEVAPDGTTTAETITDNAVSAPHIMQQGISLQANTEYVFSCFLKEGTNTHAYLSIRDTGTAQRYFAADFDLNGGTVRTSTAGSSGTLTSATITSVGNGWYRCVLIGQVSVAFSMFATIGVSDGSSSFSTFGSISYVGTGTTIYAWGAQLEARDAVTAYTPTTTQRITNYVPALQTAASGVARFDHNPTTGESLGLLIEEQRTNLVLSSGDIADGYWGVARGTKQGAAAVSPDGSLTAMKLVEDTQTGPHHINRANVSFTSGLSYTLSGFYKAGERPRVRLNLGNNGTPFPNAPNHSGLFDLLTGTIVSQGSSVTSATITSVGNGWYRCSITATAQASATDTIFLGFLVPAGQTEASYTGDGYSGLFYWGAQLEEASFPTSYIPTTSATVTRNADAASMTGTNFSSWYRADEGTLYADYFERAFSATHQVVYVSGATPNDRVNININASNVLDIQVVNGGTDTFGGNTPTLTAGNQKIALGFTTNNAGVSVNSSAVTTDTSVTLPLGLSRLEVGSTSIPSQFLNSTIKKLSFYPSRLSDAQLQALTTV